MFSKICHLLNHGIIWHAKLKLSFAKTTILFTFCCEHDSSSTGFYKACGYFGCYCNSERWKGFFIVVLVHSTVFLSVFDTDTRDSNLYVKEKAASLIEILDFFYMLTFPSYLVFVPVCMY